MSNIERDKFLTEALAGMSRPTPNSDFSTWVGFGKLWEWAQKQMWWATLLKVPINSEDKGSFIRVSYINPDEFADLIHSRIKRWENELRP